MYKKDESKFIELFSKLTGIKEDRIKEYLKEYTINSIFEHPASLTQDKKQVDKIRSINEMNNLYKNLNQHKKEYKLTSPEIAGDYFKNKFNNYMDKEYLAVAFLNTKNVVIESKIISIGTLNSSIVHPRDVMKEAIVLDSHSIMLSHNHPSGDPSPSREDKSITQRIAEAGQILGIKLLDHIITGRDEYYSFREEDINSLLAENTSTYKPSLKEKIEKAKEKSNEVDKDKKLDKNMEVEI